VETGSEWLSQQTGNRFELHEEYLNAQMVKMLKTIGYDRTYVRAEGPYLFDTDGQRYLDLLAGFGVFAMGRNHPKIVTALQGVLGGQLPDLVQLDVSLLSGILAKKILSHCPDNLRRMFFC